MVRLYADELNHGFVCMGLRHKVHVVTCINTDEGDVIELLLLFINLLYNMFMYNLYEMLGLGIINSTIQ